jgi:effector-binding domain-containing protein
MVAGAGRTVRCIRSKALKGDDDVSSAPYDIRETSVTARALAGVRAQVARGRIALEFGRHLTQVYAAARAGAVHLDGQNVFVYREAGADLLTVDFGVGITSPFTAVGEVVPRTTPEGVAATTTHHGDYARLGEAHAAVFAWCRANGRQPAGPSWEVYGHWTEDPAQLRTEVFWLLEHHGA